MISFFGLKNWISASNRCRSSLKNCLRNGDAAFPEMTAFTEMEIGKDQRFFFFPEHGAPGGK